MNTGKTYAIFGLAIRSELPLGSVEASPRPGEPDVTIRIGPVEGDETLSAGYSHGGGETILFIPRVGRFLIRDGREIVVDPAPGASERNIRLFLMGSAFGALLHQRGLMPLHANAVVIGERAFAFCGHSGAGKSTMAAWFHDRGHPILADDVCVLGFDAAGEALAFPGVPRVRLWREALEASGRIPGDYERSFDDTDKYDVPIASAPRTEPVPLAAIYLLAKAEGSAAAGRIERLTGVDAVEALVSNTYRGAYLQTIGATGPHLAICARLARAVPVFRAERAWGLELLDSEAGRIEAQARSLLDASEAQGAR